jgi:peptide/nickel transport system substrate-binding protein
MTQHTRSRRPQAATALVSAVLLALTACSSESDGNQSSGGAPATFVYAAPGVVNQFDIWTTYEGESSRTVGFEWGSSLVEYDGSADNNCDVLVPSSSLRANLAERWEYNADKSQLRIKLRSDVKSAAGNVLTAEDVVWSFDRAVKQSSIAKFLATSVAQFDAKKPFEVIDPATVGVNIATPTALDVAVFTWPHFNVLDTTEVKKHVTAADPLAKEWLKSNVANFGPWKLADFKPGEEVVYEKNPNFWDADSTGNINRFVLRSVPDAATRLQLLESGAVDYAEKLAFDQYSQVEKSRRAKLVNCASPNRDTLMLNQKFPSFAKPEVRRALSFAINREALTSGVYKGFAKPATTGISEVYWKAPADAAKFSYDAEQAKQLLSSAGVANLSFAIMASPSRPGAYAQSLAVQIQSMLDAAGVKTTINMVPGATEFSDDFFASKYDAVVYSEPPAVGDPFYSANLYNSTESFQNTFGYHNAQYDGLVKQIQRTEPGPARDELLRQISDVMAETMPQVYLTDTRYLHAFGKTTEGYENTPNGALLVYRLKKG